MADDYRRATGNAIDYASFGSDAGVDRVARGLVDFGGTDVPLVADELARLQLLQFPVVIGGVVPVVNISDIASGRLRLSGAVLAAIYFGDLRKWNAEPVAAVNLDLA